MKTDDKFAFLWVTSVLDSMVGHTCDFMVIKQNVYAGIMVFVLEKNSQYKPLFDYL